MRIELNLLSRRPVTFGPFEVIDIVLLVLFVFMMPLAVWAFKILPLYLSFFLFATPAIIFVFRFRIRKRPGYFVHWLDYKVRPRDWVCGFSQRFRADDFPSRTPGWTSLPRGGKLGCLPRGP